MTKVATIDIKTLKAVNCFVSSEETRYYLCGVLLEVYNDGVIYVATDGHRMACKWQELGNEPPNTLVGKWIIPSEVIKGLKIGKRMTHSFATLKGHDDNANKLTIDFDGQAITFLAIDGTFPEWRRFVPQTVEEKVETGMSYNGKYMNSIYKFGWDMDIGMADWHYNGNGPAVITFSEDHTAFCIVMPMRTSGMAWSKPDWINAPHTVTDENLMAAE